MDTHGTMASYHKFQNTKSVNMENPQNLNLTKIKAHMVLWTYDECTTLGTEAQNTPGYHRMHLNVNFTPGYHFLTCFSL